MARNILGEEIRAAEAKTETARRKQAVDDGRFAALDRLAERDPDAFEKALTRLSAAELDAYLASQ